MAKLVSYDYEIAVLAWIGSLATAWLGPWAVLLIAAATFNLYHQRRVMFQSGTELERRVVEILSSRLADYENRIKQIESGIADVKESQVKIAGAFRGRQLPS